MQAAAKALASLCICTGSPDHTLLDDANCTKFLHVSPYVILFTDLRKYLGCQLSNDGTTGKLCVEDNSFTFQAIGIKGSYDHPDGQMNVYSEHDLRNSQSSNGSMETDESSSEPLSLTQSSISSHNSSLDSGNGSQTDSGYEGLSVRTSGFEEQDCHDFLLETGGKHLSCKTPTTPMANLNILHGLGSTEHNP